MHKDHLGSTRLVSDVTGAFITDCFDFYPFGQANVPTTPCSSGSSAPSHSNTTHEFTGDERDSETSLDHTWFRQYSSQFGRWTSPDPAGLAAVDPSNPQSWNRYAYALNNSMNLVDPSGLDSCAGLKGKTLFACLSLLGQENSHSCIDPQSGISAPCNLPGTGWDEFDLMQIPVTTGYQYVPFYVSGVFPSAGEYTGEAWLPLPIIVGNGLDLFRGIWFFGIPTYTLPLDSDATKPATKTPAQIRACQAQYLNSKYGQGTSSFVDHFSLLSLFGPSRGSSMLTSIFMGGAKATTVGVITAATDAATGTAAGQVFLVPSTVGTLYNLEARQACTP